MMGCCEFAGQLEEMLHHVTVQHIQHPEITVYKFSTTLILNKTHPDSEIYNQVALRILGDVFYLRWNTKNGFLYLTLLFVGEKEDASEFVYEASLHSVDGVGRMAARQQCRSYLELIDDQVLIKKTELCMAFPLSFVEQCVKEGQETEVASILLFCMVVKVEVGVFALSIMEVVLEISPKRRFVFFQEPYHVFEFDGRPALPD
ncbi:hypothetical protein C0J52_19745 [Blattella germanica]|nr:hypothetical protein C0J52_19745 [Blattella germanica]